ncbi:MAG: hypothetical protein OXG39_12655 [Chloroflexi bacterium]|nr:hypothetical protein [Chloroflexota bacterium]
MAWTTPKTDWSTGELVTAADINAIGGNLVELRRLSTTIASHTTTADITTPYVPQFADIDSHNLNLTLVTAGGDVLVHFHGVFIRGSGDDTDNCLDIVLDGNRQGDDENGFMRFGVYGRRRAQSFTRLIQNLSAGSHAFKLQWRNWKRVKLYAGAQFWVREI